MGDFGTETDQMVEPKFGGKRVIDFNILAGNTFSCVLIQKNTWIKNPEGKVMKTTVR
jgi:hypothetical protein